MEAIYSESFFISANEANAEQELALPLLIARIIDVATDHANSLHIGNPDMTDISGGWVLSRLTVEMNRYPRVNEFFKIRTWVPSFNRHFSERSFDILDGEGETIGHANSIWMILNTQTREGMPLTHFTLAPELTGRPAAPIARQAKHHPIGEAERSEPDRHYRFCYCDLDCYRHVNTVRYVTLLLNSFTLDDFDRTRVGRFELSFLREAHYDLTVTVRRRDDNPLQSSISLIGEDDGRPVLFSRIIRENRE